VQQQPLFRPADLPDLEEAEADAREALDLNQEMELMVMMNDEEAQREAIDDAIVGRPRPLRRADPNRRVDQLPWAPGATLWFTGKMAPVGINPNSSHWCTLGGAFGHDAEVLGHIHAAGCTTCACTHTLGGACIHYWALRAKMLWDQKFDWLRMAGNEMMHIFDNVPNFPRIQVELPHVPIYDPDRLQVVEDPPAFFVEEDPDLAPLLEDVHRYGPARYPAFAALAIDPAGAHAIGALVGLWGFLRWLRLMMWARFRPVLIRVPPLFAWVTWFFTTIGVVATATWVAVGRLYAAIRQPEFIYTTYSDTPLAGHYLVPTKRAGWKPFATIDHVGALSPEGRPTTWADYDRASYISGLSIAAQSRDRERTDYLTPEDRPEGYRIATCKGLWPAASQDHCIRSVQCRDPLTNEICHADCAELRPDHNPGDLSPFWLWRLAFVVILAFHLIFTTFGWASVHPSWFPDRLAWLAGKLWVVPHYLLWVMLGVRVELWHFLVALGSFMSTWVWEVAIQTTGMIVSITLADKFIGRLTRPGIYRPNPYHLLAHILLMLAALYHHGRWSSPGTALYLLRLAIVMSGAFAARPPSKDWFRIPKSMQLSHFLATRVIPTAPQVLTKIQTQWSRTPDTLLSKVRDAVVQAYLSSGEGSFGSYDAGAIEALALLCSPDDVDSNMGFMRSKKACQKLARIKGWSYDPNLRVIKREYIDKVCARPGCGERRAKGKWPHGLCPDCTFSLTLPNANATARSWVEGEDVCAHQHALATRFVPIPDLQLPLPNVPQEPSVVYFDAPGLYGAHMDWCPLRHMSKDQVRSYLECRGQCRCTLIRVKDKDPGHPRLAGWLAGFGINRVPPYVVMKSPINVLRAIACRIARLRQIRPVPWAWKKALEFLDVFLPDWKAIPIQPLTLQEWLASFPPARRRILTECATTWFSQGKPLTGRDLMFQIFIKREWACRSEPAGTTEIMVPILHIKPRSILPPFGPPRLEDVGHLIVGPVTRAVLHRVKEIWNSYNFVFYGSTDPATLDGWLQRNADAAVWLGNDYSAYDMSHSSYSWDFLEPLYNAALGEDWIHSEHFAQVMRHWRAPRGKVHVKWESFTHLIRFFAIAMNASGRDDTALANVILNAFAMYLSLVAVHCDCEVADVTPAMVVHCMSELQLAVVGDDSLAALPRVTRSGRLWAVAGHDVATNVALFGFTSKSVVTTRIHDAIFLGNRPYRVNSEWVWGPTLGRRLYKHHCCIHTHANPVAWLHGIVKMESEHLGFIPILGAMARRARELLRGSKVTAWKADPYSGLDWKARKIARHPDRETYLECATAYTDETGTLTVEEILDLERIIGEVTSLPIILSHPALDRVCLHDEM
jgi:hypothetical protein